MRYVAISAAIFGLLAMGIVLAACATSEPGGSYAMGEYTDTLPAAPDKVTAAAEKAASDLKLLQINATSTAIDGKVTAMTADHTNVTIQVAEAGPKVSKVSIRVGAMGDENLSGQLFDRIKADL